MMLFWEIRGKNGIITIISTIMHLAIHRGMFFSREYLFFKHMNNWKIVYNQRVLYFTLYVRLPYVGLTISGITNRIIRVRSYFSRSYFSIGRPSTFHLYFDKKLSRYESWIWLVVPYIVRESLRERYIDVILIQPKSESTFLWLAFIYST